MTVEFDWEAFGSAVKTRRRSEGRSLRDLAKYLGMNLSTISRIERGRATDVPYFLLVSAWLGRAVPKPLKVCSKCKGTGYV